MYVHAVRRPFYLTEKSLGSFSTFRRCKTYVSYLMAKKKLRSVREDQNF